jgi:SOS response regulatory protein OraA/RecX
MIDTKKNNTTKDINSLTKNLALKYISRYFVNSYKLKDYLKRKLTTLNYLTKENETEIDAIILNILIEFEKNKYINDAFYSKTKSLSLVKKGKSISHINSKLSLLGVAEIDIKQSIKTLSPEGSSYNLELLSAIYFLAKKRLGAYFNTAKKIKLPKNQQHLNEDKALEFKTKDALYKNGFSTSVINAIIKLNINEINALKEHLLSQVND